MPRVKPTPLVIAVRVYPDLKKDQPTFDMPQREWRRPGAMLVFDTETRTDSTQGLTFGSYRFIVAGQCVAENLFYGDDLSTEECKVLANYVADLRAGESNGYQVYLLTRGEFVEKLFRAAYKGRCLLVAFNFPFDISRIAFNFKNARGRFAGGFSFDLWSHKKNGFESWHQFRPSISIKHIDSKRALKGFTRRKRPDEEDLIPEGSLSGKPEKDYVFRGHFLDLRTLAFALTDRGYTLEAACEDFGVEHVKTPVKRHGLITKRYIDYNRRDVLATSELADKLLEEYDKHDITLQETKAYSSASIGKAYLRRMGIAPVLERQPRFPRRYLGHAQSAFYGGRTSAHIRKVSMPVVYTDFLSMYPTVNRLMDLWQFVIAREIGIVKHCHAEIEQFLKDLSVDKLFEPATWKSLCGFVQIVPEGDILPSRGRYSTETHDWQVAINYLYTTPNDDSQALWFSLPDVVASVLLTNRIPKIVDAFRIEPHGKIPNLKSAKLRGRVAVDPRRQDLFQVVIEERHRLPSLSVHSDVERKRLDKALKVLANATSYGIYAEMHRLESEQKRQVTCYGIDPTPSHPRVAHPDEPGAYCFPPLASLITGAARLMLALLESQVKELQGTYVMEDTDSMAIVATEHGGFIPCPGGPFEKDGQQAVKALSWNQVKQISDRFAALNPYDQDAVPGSVLKIEKDNYDPETGKQRQVYCFAISAKRYALYLLQQDGTPVLLRKGINNDDDRWSEHGLGHLLNPTDIESDDRDWIAQAWFDIINKTLGLQQKGIGFADLAAVGRTTISSPAVMEHLQSLNKDEPYSQQIKPFNFLLGCHIRPLGHPFGTNPERFHLIAPYELNAKKWLKMEWIDQYSGARYRITTAGQHGSRHSARVQTYGEVLQEYEFHPESKCADADGTPCTKQTVGLLQRRHVQIDLIKQIGKESNSLEEVEAGLIQSAENVYTEYPDPRRDEWATKIWPIVSKVPLPHLEKQCRGAISRRGLRDILARGSRPHLRNQKLLMNIVRKLGLL